MGLSWSNIVLPQSPCFEYKEFRAATLQQIFSYLHLLEGPIEQTNPK